MLRLLTICMTVGSLFACQPATRMNQRERNAPQSSSKQSIGRYKTYFLRGSLRTTRGNNCALGTIACVNDTGVFKLTGSDLHGQFDLQLSPEEFHMIRAIQITALDCDTIIEKFNGAVDNDSIIHREYRLRREPIRYSIVNVVVEDGPPLNLPNDTIWLKPDTNSYPKHKTTKHIIRYDRIGSESRIDTAWPNVDGNFDPGQ